MLKRTTGFIIIAVIFSVVATSGCGATLSPTSAIISGTTSIPVTSTPSLPPETWPSPTTTLPPGQEPVEVVSVVGPVPYSTAGGKTTWSPGGPIVEITLDNVSNEPVIYLTASLGISGMPANTPFIFNFRVTSDKPLAPGQSVSVKQTLIGGGFSSTVQYPVTINGTLQSLAAFTYTKQVQIVPPAQ